MNMYTICNPQAYEYAYNDIFIGIFYNLTTLFFSNL